MRDAPGRRFHVLGDFAAKADNLDLLATGTVLIDWIVFCCSLPRIELGINISY